MYMLPPEVVTLIFQHCDSLSQACALAQTSSYTHRVWQGCRSTLAWSLAQREVVAFEDALMAVRAIRWKMDLLQDRFHREQLMSLSVSKAKRPSWSEIIEVMSLKRVAQLLENKFRCCAEWYQNSPEQVLVPDVARRKTCYRRLIQLMRADSVVAGEYVETLIKKFGGVVPGTFTPIHNARISYSTGSGDYHADEKRRKSFEEFLILLASCVLENSTEIIIPERRLFDPYGQQYWPRRQRDAFNASQRLTTMFA